MKLCTNDFVSADGGLDELAEYALLAKVPSNSHTLEPRAGREVRLA